MGGESVLLVLFLLVSLPVPLPSLTVEPEG